MATVVKRFKSAISNVTTVTAYDGENGGYYFTISKSKLNKDTKKWEDTPFLHAQDLAAIMSECRQALAFIDANPLEKRDRDAAQPTGTVQKPGAKASDDSDDIPF